MEELLNQIKKLAEQYKTVRAEKVSQLSANAANPAPTTAAASQTLQGSVGKGGQNLAADVRLVQTLLKSQGYNLVPDGDCGPKTIAAIADFQKTKMGNPAPDGRIDVGGATWRRLSGASPANPNPNPAPTPTDGGKPHRAGSTIYTAGAFLISLPPNASGALPLVLLFAGKGQKNNALLTQVPDDYYTSAIMVFGTAADSFSAAQAAWNALLSKKGCSASTISVCGYSLGGQAAYRAYSNATKAVGLIDPTTYYKNLAQLDSKAVLSCNPPIWGFSANKPGEPNYRVVEALRDAVKIVQEKGGVSETSSTAHGVYPKYFLAKFKSQLI